MTISIEKVSNGWIVFIDQRGKPPTKIVCINIVEVVETVRTWSLLAGGE